MIVTCNKCHAQYNFHQNLDKPTKVKCTQCQHIWLLDLSADAVKKDVVDNTQPNDENKDVEIVDAEDKNKTTSKKNTFLLFILMLILLIIVSIQLFILLYPYLKDIPYVAYVYEYIQQYISVL